MDHEGYMRRAIALCEEKMAAGEGGYCATIIVRDGDLVGADRPRVLWQSDLPGPISASTSARWRARSRPRASSAAAPIGLLGDETFAIQGVVGQRGPDDALTTTRDLPWPCRTSASHSMPTISSGL